MKVAYLLGSVARYKGRTSGQTYDFTPWAEVGEDDWPEMASKQIFKTGCCGKPSRVYRVFATEDEIRTGAPNVDPQWR